MIKEWCEKCDGSGRHGFYGGENEKVVCPYCQGKGYTELEAVNFKDTQMEKIYKGHKVYIKEIKE